VRKGGERLKERGERERERERKRERVLTRLSSSHLKIESSERGGKKPIS
jgi:Mn-dependent DtxR family transcriptional regulator